MPEVTSHAPGSFCWIELNTSDPAAAKQFYSGLFGWDAEDTPAGPDMVYTMLRIKGLDVAAMCGLQAEQKAHGVPPHWMTYVTVESADDAAAKAASLGGKVMAGAFDVMDVGRMAVIQDPQGAVFCVWQPKAHIGARLVGETGTFGWDELWTTDTKKAVEFYTGLFGWGAKEGSPQLAPGTSKEQELHKRENTSQLLATTDANLKSVAARQLTPAQQSMMEQIRTYITQSKAASDSGDLDRAHTLAYKAHLLSDELAKK